ncbi:hypothetical protein GCM10023147_27130 [Tsukamurella soli]|uniref:SnoaL-like domain-containing protein n=1 Tax=Tsukamurella soli TaxID=644556 RepID=A0ABP8JRR9_9ACTN
MIHRHRLRDVGISEKDIGSGEYARGGGGRAAATHRTIYAPDAVHEFPWASEGQVRRLEGREAIAAYMRQLPGHIVFGPFEDVQVREVGDETIVQATGRHRRPDGTPRDLSYIGFITRRDGKVTRWQDYMNALQP